MDSLLISIIKLELCSCREIVETLQNYLLFVQQIHHLLCIT